MKSTRQVYIRLGVGKKTQRKTEKKKERLQNATKRAEFTTDKSWPLQGMKTVQVEHQTRCAALAMFCHGLAFARVFDSADFRCL